MVPKPGTVSSADRESAQSKMDCALRKTYRTQLTKLVKSAQERIESGSHGDAIEITVLIERIKAVQMHLRDINEKIAPTISENEMEEACEKIIEYDDAAVDILARLNGFKDKHERETRTCIKANSEIVESTRVEDNSDSASVDGNRSESESMHLNRVHMFAKLPKLDLIKFGGEIDEWPAFWEQYSAAIHDNDSLSESAKYAYLKSVLHGKAAITIAGLTSCQASYDDAIELLKEEYANTERIVDAYILKLTSLPPVRNEKDIEGMRKLHNYTTTATRSLNTLGIAVEQYGLLVKSTIYNALPYTLKVQYNKIKLSRLKSDGHDVNYGQQIADLLDFIKVEIDANEQARNLERARDKNGVSNRNQSFTAAGLLSNVKDECLFCKGKTHSTSDCRSNKTINEKKTILRQYKRCFRCTRAGHNAKYCKTKFSSCSKCKGKHVTTMCDPNYKRPRSSPNEAVLNSEAVAVANLSSAHRKSTIHLQTAVAIIKTKGNDAPIRIIFDGGSHLTFIKKKVVDELRLRRIDSVRISVACFGDTRRATPKWHNVVEVRFKSQFNENTIVLRAVVVEEICSESLSAPLTDDLVIKNFALSHQLADLNAEYFGVSNEIGMLIGADNYWQIVTGESHKLADNLMALNTKLGWTILGDSGSTRQSDQTITDSNVMLCLHSDTEYDIRNFWNLETLGINVNEKADNMMESFISEKIMFKNNRYEVSLPWSTTDSIDSCYNIALAHAKNLTRKLHRQGKLREYDQAIRDYFSNDSAEEANVKPDNDRVYYMPHRPVYREDKDTTKVRIVFNASAHAPDCRSLNDMLLTGDNLMPELLNILLNFRIGRIGIIGDIEKAFLQISVHENDRDALRFLWYRDPIRNEVSSLSDLPPLQSYRMKRVTFGVTSSPFLLNATIRKHLEQQPAEHKDLVNLLIKSFYVDDLILGSNSFEEAVSIFEYARSTMLDAGMNLRKWKTNDVNLSRVFNEAGHDESGGETKKVLGVNWHTSTDELSIDIRPVVEGMNFTLITKRIVLQVIARIFDPLGMLVPFVVRAKLLLQAIWKAKLNWDEELPSKMQHEWKKWCVEIKELTSLTIARCIAPDKNEDYELHIFADASKVAYGAVAYIKSSNKCQPSFVLSKGRIAPINKENKETLTLPELELTAALCAVRLQDYLISNLSLHIKRVILWSDSKIALHWINGQSLRWKVYVKNRVIEIKKRSKGEWKYCPGKENPADLATRGISSKLLTTSTLWLSGPVWLSCSSEEWPEEESINDSHLSTISCFVEEIDNEYCPFTPIFPLDRYSSILKIHRITAYVQRFCNNLKGDREKAKGPLTTKEIAIAENYWLRFVQGTEYEVEIDALKAKKKVPTHSSIVKLNPKLNDDGLLKLGSRLEESSLPYETIYPIILPKNSVYTERLIWAAHEHTMHGGVNAVLTAIRRRFWIIKGRQKVKSVISKCVKCKRLHGKHGEEPFAPLPRNRITPVRPFEITGVDFAGPLYVKEENGSNKKVYIMLLTCAVVRAVHLELVTDMTAETCVRAFRRFFARRGVPKTIYSDNAMTFKRVSRDLCVLFNSLKTESFQNLAATQNFEWRFIVERAAWWGGFWERMVRSVKTALKITLGKSTVGFDEMHTILLEVEAVVNARPLTYIDEDPANLEILSPAHFLMMAMEM